ncbi:MAG TPA: sulfur carrier protein ThiS adenylyltransferase ThiF [Bacteroidales bacterium]|jgi:sulfur carrier protein ThiS adenylyltransferase|nr:sulfur carrier protein ThiS adenylyltransferase ThiF [Bacteroidales bacterium]
MKIAEIEKHLGKFRVGVAGAGGLGSNCAICLARAGVGTLVIADFDVVEISNLSRQYYFSDQTGRPKVIALQQNINRINPDIRVIPYQVKLDAGNIPVIFKGCNLIVEAFDRADMKEMLIDTVQREMPGVALIVGSGIAGWGKSEDIKCRKIDDSLYICGDETLETSEELPPVAPRVSMVASMQANLAVELLMKMN